VSNCVNHPTFGASKEAELYGEQIREPRIEVAAGLAVEHTEDVTARRPTEEEVKGEPLTSEAVCS
jgi:hypothetical protein